MNARDQQFQTEMCARRRSVAKSRASIMVSKSLMFANGMVLLGIALLAARPAEVFCQQARRGFDELRSQQELVLCQKQHGPERGYNSLLIEEREFDDIVFEADVRSLPGVTHYGLVFRYQDEENFYRLVVRPASDDFRVEKVISGQSDYASTGHVAYPMRANRWYDVRLACRGDRVEVWIDEERVFQRSGFGELDAGRVGVTNFDPVGAEFDSVRIRSADGKEVLFQDDFNSGKLDDWTTVGPDNVRGQWGSRPKIERKQLREDFVERYSYAAVKSLGRTHDLLDFPSIMKLKSGELLSIFIEEYQHGTPPWAAQPASGKLWMMRSTDFGRSWSNPTPFLDTPLDDRHCYTLQLSSGDLLAFWWVQTRAFGTWGILNFVSRSTDGGMTWTDPRRVRSGKPGLSDPLKITGGFSLTVPPSELPDGTIVMPIHCQNTADRPLPEIGLLRSHDGGRTWDDYNTIAYHPEGSVSYVEPAVVRVDENRWIAVMRTEVPVNPGQTHPYKLGPTMTCSSRDGGRTWSEPERLPLSFTWQASTAPFLLKTESDVVVFAVNTGLAFSYDGGETWEPQALKCGYYPNLLEITPNTIATLAAGMEGKAFSLTRPTEGESPPGGVRTRPELGHRTPKSGPTAAAEDRSVAGQLAPDQVKPLGMFRAVRVRAPRDPQLSPLLAQPDWPILAVARAATGDGQAIIGVIRDVEGTWSSPRAIASGMAIEGDPLLAQGANGTLRCMFAAQSAGTTTMMITASRDGGRKWSPPAEIRLLDSKQGELLMTSPPVEDADGAWLVAGTRRVESGEDQLGIFRSHDAAESWQCVAQCPQAGNAKTRLVEASLAVTRDGRWVVLARQVDGNQKGNQLALTVSSDRGSSWSEPRAVNLKGTKPEIVELFDSLFIALADGGEQRMNATYAWDGLDHFQVSPLACGYCVRVGGRTYLARGAGADLSGNYNNLHQVPLSSEEVSHGLAQATRRLPVGGDAFTFKGEWERTEEEASDSVFVSTDPRALAEVAFNGRVAVLVHDRMPAGRLVRVVIDGHEYPPVDMSGKRETDARTCLAVGLSPGPHTLVLRPLLAWRPGTMSVRALEVSGAGE